MPVFFVIDDDGPTRATREALSQRDIEITIHGLGANGGADCDAVVADACMLRTNGAYLRTAAHLIAISREGDLASIQDAPDFRTMAGRLATR